MATTTRRQSPLVYMLALNVGFRGVGMSAGVCRAVPSSCQHLPLPGCSASRLGGLGASSANEPCKSVSGGIQGSAKISWHFFYPSGPGNPARVAQGLAAQPNSSLLAILYANSRRPSWHQNNIQPSLSLSLLAHSNPINPSPPPPLVPETNSASQLRTKEVHPVSHMPILPAHKLTNPSAQRTQPAPFLSLSAPDFLAPLAKQPSSPPATTRESHRAYRQPGHRLASNLGTHRTRRVAFRKAVNFHGRQERLHDKTLARAERSRKRVERV